MGQMHGCVDAVETVSGSSHSLQGPKIEPWLNQTHSNKTPKIQCQRRALGVCEAVCLTHAGLLGPYRQ